MGKRQGWIKESTFLLEQKEGWKTCIFVDLYTALMRHIKNNRLTVTKLK